MTYPTVYLLLPGTAREALEFYHGVFGGEMGYNTYEEFQRTDGPADAVAHGMLKGDVTLFCSDAGADENALVMDGMMLSILGDRPDDFRRWFDALAQGGRVLNPLEKRPWGDYDGQLVDRFGVRWLIGFIEGIETP